MRNLLFLLAGFGLILVLLPMLAGTPAAPGGPEEAAATEAKPSLFLPALLVAVSWASLLLRGSMPLRVLVAMAISAAALLVLEAGLFVAWWDRHMRPDETIGAWLIGAGLLALLAQAIVWYRGLHDTLDP